MQFENKLYINKKLFSMKKNLLTIFFLSVSFILSAQATTPSLQGKSGGGSSLTQYVDPRIGSGDHGHVFVGANVPFGMVNAGPTQLEEGWDWCSGYHESGTKIVGFAQTHLSGTGCSDLGDIAIMPVTGDVTFSREGLATPYSHDNEEVRPGYYSVLLGTDKKVPSLASGGTDNRSPELASGGTANRSPELVSGGLPAGTIRTEITAARRCAQYRITYPAEAKTQSLVIDLENGVGDRVRASRLSLTSDNTGVGYRISHGWAYEQHCYFAIRFSRPVKESWDLQTGSHYYRLDFEPSTEPLIVTIALSPVSEFNAQQNMVGPFMTFDAMRQEADEQWNRNLARVQASFLNDRDRRIFYTAMYHFMVAPQTWDDENGDWRGADNRVYRLQTGQGPQDDGRDGFAWPFGATNPSYLTTLSLWDTYRAAAPLGTIILPEMMPSVTETYLRIFREQGKLPVWHLMSQETDCMVGCPAVPILADALLKGFVKDSLAAIKAMTSSLLMDERGLDDMKAYGYVANDHHGESLSRSLEYMLADWSAVQAGKAVLNAKRSSLNEKQAEELSKTIGFLDKRSHSYPALYDKRVGFFRGKNSDGSFENLEGFNPNHQTRPFTEGNPWQYLWLVPQDVDGLMQMLGGRDIAVKRLDSLFTADSQLNENAQPDISGLIGQYAHGNEPSHHIAYLYALMGQPRKTAKIVKQIQRELYTDQPAGLCGNEDVGQMSAWYILSALGFYQVEPCGGRYVLGSPLVKEAAIHVGNGKTFTIRTHDLSEKAIYIKKVLLNGQPLPVCTTFSSCTEKLPKGYVAPFILRHEDLVRGGTLDIFMSK